MPIATATVDTRERERLGARGHRLRQHVLYAAFHDTGSGLALTVQCDDGPDRPGDPGWPGNTPFGADSAAGGGNKRAGRDGAVGAGGEGPCSEQRGAGTGGRTQLE